VGVGLAAAAAAAAAALNLCWKKKIRGDGLDLCSKKKKMRLGAKQTCAVYLGPGPERCVSDCGGDEPVSVRLRSILEPKNAAKGLSYRKMAHM
jgi:hypothetical protein